MTTASANPPATTTATPSLRERAAAAAKERGDKHEAYVQKRRAERRQQAHDTIVGQIARRFGAEPDRIIEIDLGDEAVGGYDYHISHIAELEGMLFQYRRSRYREYELHVARTCAHCQQRCWLPIGRNSSDLPSLHDALTRPDSEVTHENIDGWACRQVYGEDGEPITDREGKPLPARGPFTEKAAPTVDEQLAMAMRAFIANELDQRGVGL